jgi:para-nitrobenzyl esterase
VRRFTFTRFGLRCLTVTAALLGTAAAVVLVLGGSSAARVTAHAQRAHRVAPARHRDPLVQTNKGPVRGFVTNGVTEFLGVPYAAPPVGALRWRPPRPHASWHKPLDASAYGSACPQVVTDAVLAQPSVNENCLYLNVFTPKVGHLGKRARPVFLWIHGGGNQLGSAEGYDGSKLANGGKYGGSDTVVVSINYRMGLFGFLADPALDREGHPFANYGIMDQQAALRWVQRNIAAFGGDPHKVAVGGQSAGSTDTGANVLSPLSHGLFNRAIFESTPLATLPTLATGLAHGEGFAKAAGCPGESAATAACLRALSAPRILQLSGTLNRTGPYITGPMVDGTVLPLTPEQAYTTGRYNHMPMMGGNVKDEQNWTIAKNEYFSGTPVDAQTYVNDVTATYGTSAYPAGTVAKILAEYPLSNYATPQLADDAALTDPKACSSLHVDGLLSQRVPVYAYEFDYQHAPFYLPSLPGYVPLAAHTIDIQFLFPQFHGGVLGVNLDQATGQPRGLNARESRLSDQLVAAWTNLANTGNPNGTGKSPWPQFASNGSSILSENAPNLSTYTNAQFSAAHKCGFWNNILTY